MGGDDFGDDREVEPGSGPGVGWRGFGLPEPFEGMSCLVRAPAPVRQPRWLAHTLAHEQKSPCKLTFCHGLESR